MNVVGLMSGTSLDGIDACLVEIEGAGDRLAVKQRHALTMPFPPGLRERLLTQLDPATSDVAALAHLNVALGEAFAEAALACVAEAGLALNALDAIGSHGQTLWHAPAGAHPATLQLGEPAVIAERTGVTTVANFRAADVAAGGQGAPLVPYVDKLLFGHLGPVALLNLGGIGNVTALPGPGSGAPVLAFDTGPGNMIMDQLAAFMSDGRLTCDRDGAIADAGQVDEAWLAEILAADPFLAAPPPKSTGREAYGRARAEAHLAEGRRRGLADAAIMATAAAWTAASVAEQVRRFLTGPHAPKTLYVSGGGARNPAVMRELATRLGLPVEPLARLGIDSDAKEALAFAVLAHQTLTGATSNVPAATGAVGPRVLGQIAPGANFSRVVLRVRPPEAASGPTTERANPASRGLDTLSAREAAAVMHAQDYDAVRAIEPAQDAIAGLVERVASALGNGGRLFYVGAGTSGRLGVLDASECPPTFSTPPEWVQGVIAGGEQALTRAVEGAEDDAEAGARDIGDRGVGERDVVVGLSANGGAPYVQGALDAARRAGATTALVTCNPVGADRHQPDVAVVLPVGPEIVAGSTRLKAGTATKLVLNMVSTLAMVQLGKVHDNMMVDVQVSNRKLLERARRLVGRLTGLAPDAAEALLARAGGSVKLAAAMHATQAGPDEARAALARHGGRLRPLLEKTRA